MTDTQNPRGTTVDWPVNARVKRRKDVHRDKGPWMHGTVVGVTRSRFDSADTYAVLWDGKKQADRGYFWWGLEAV